MNQPLCQAPDCDRPSPHDRLCPDCVNQLVADLRALPELLAELDVTVTRQNRHGVDAGVRSRSAERPLPFPWGAADLALHALPNTLHTWARDLAETYELPEPDSWVLPRLTVWLVEHTHLIRAHPAAGEMHDELTAAVEAVRKAIDNPPARSFAGPCDECGADLYGWPGAVTVTCHECGREHDMAQRRQWLLEVVEDRLLDAEEIASAVSAWLGVPISRDRIRQWVHRERLVAHSYDAQGRRLYRGGDAITLARHAAAGATRKGCA